MPRIPQLRVVLPSFNLNFAIDEVPFWNVNRLRVVETVFLDKKDYREQYTWVSPR